MAVSQSIRTVLYMYIVFLNPWTFSWSTHKSILPSSETFRSIFDREIHSIVGVLFHCIWDHYNVAENGSVDLFHLNEQYRTFNPK